MQLRNILLPVPSVDGVGFGHISSSAVDQVSPIVAIVELQVDDM